MIFSAALYDKGLIFFVKICLIDAHLFFEYFVRQKANMYLYRQVIFLSSINNRVMLLFVKIYRMNEHLFYKYFVRVGLSEICYLWMFHPCLLYKYRFALST